VVEVESGRKSRTGRPALRKAIDDCANDGAVLIIAKLDRLSRNFNFMSKITEGAERDGVGIVACDVPDLGNPATSKFLWRILAAVAELEAEQTSERTKAALASARKRGVKLGAPDSEQASKQGRKALQYDTIAYSKNVVLPEIKKIEKLGIVGLRATARELNERKIATYQAHLMDLEVSLRGKRNVENDTDEQIKKKRQRPIWRAQTVKQALQNAKKSLPKVKSRQAGK